jgi:hypothetical protein
MPTKLSTRKVRRVYAHMAGLAAHIRLSQEFGWRESCASHVLACLTASFQLPSTREIHVLSFSASAPPGARVASCWYSSSAAAHARKRRVMKASPPNTEHGRPEIFDLNVAFCPAFAIYPVGTQLPSGRVDF